MMPSSTHAAKPAAPQKRSKLRKQATRLPSTDATLERWSAEECQSSPRGHVVISVDDDGNITEKLSVNRL